MKDRCVEPHTSTVFRLILSGDEKNIDHYVPNAYHRLKENNLYTNPHTERLHKRIETILLFPNSIFQNSTDVAGERWMTVVAQVSGRIVQS